jgi:HPt (histidine-containing phosphotransfer) domain-containing protein
MIDRTKLESLLGGDPKMVQRFLDIFKSQTPEQLNLLEKYVAVKNWDMASIAAHGIKSQCRYFGLEDIAELAFSIEQLTDVNEKLEVIPSLVADLKEKLIEIIKKELS